MADEKDKTIDKPIGVEGVNHLVKIYLGRDATAEELNRFKDITGSDDSILRDYLKDLQTNEKDKEIENIVTDVPSTAFFRGGDSGALIKFSEDPSGGDNKSTVWFVDPKLKILRPILSEQAFNNAFEKTLEETASEGGIVTLPLSALQQGKVLGGYTMLTDQYGIKNDGTYEKTESTFDVNKIRGRYGKPRSVELERGALKQLNGFLKLLKNDPKSGVSQDLIDEISNNEEIVGTYLNAFAYGDYQLPDIYRDLKRRELVKQGNDNMKELKVIDETTPANTFYRAEGGNARTNPDLTPPNFLGDISTSLLESNIFNIPDDVFKILVPPLDFTSPEGQAEMDKIKSAYHDVLLKQIEATNDREKAIADQLWNNFKSDMEKNYGMKLGDNAYNAWNDIIGLGSDFSQRGLLGTGVEREAIDKYLRDVRKGDQRLREERLTREERERANHLMQYGSPEEINALSEEEKVKYGFKPSEDVMNFFSKESLKERYPNLSDEEIEAYAGSIVDKFGNYRSQIYQTMASNVLKTQQDKRLFQQGSVQIDPDTGKVIGGYGAAYKKALEEEKAYAPFRKEERFSKPDITPETTRLTEEQKRENFMRAVKKTIPKKEPAKPTVGQKIRDPRDLRKYTEKDIVRVGGDIYLKPKATPKATTTTTTPVRTKIRDPKELSKYTEKQIERVGKDIFLRPTPTKTTPTPTRTKIHDPAELGKYKENEILREGGSIYLKPGIKKR